MLLLAMACGPSATGNGGGDVDAAPGSDGASSDAAPGAARMYVHTPDTLYVMDDQSFELVLVGPFGLGDNEDINDMAVTPEGKVYGISRDKLYAIDENKGAATYIADVPGTVNVGMTFLGDGTLLATDKEGDVRQIDPLSGSVTDVGSFGNGFATAGDLVAVANGTMFALSDDGPRGTEFEDNELLVVDTLTGVGTGIGAIGFGQVYGCAVANNRIYAFTRDGLVIEIDPSLSGSTPAVPLGRMVRSHPVVFFGAGVTPRAAID